MPPEKSKVSSLAGKLSKSTFFGTSINLPKVIELEIAKLDPNPDQPRKHFDEIALQELADSIGTHGLIQPITVKPIPNSERFMIVAGERRWRAHQLAGKETIFAITTDGNADEIALIENIQRENLEPLEEAEALAGLATRHKYTQEQLGKAVGKARNTISELLSLNNLPEEIKAECRTSDVFRPGKSVLVEIARLPERDKQMALWAQLKAQPTTVRGAREHKASGTAPSDHAKRYQSVIATAHRLKRLIHRLEGLSSDEFNELEGVIAAAREAAQTHVSDVQRSGRRTT